MLWIVVGCIAFGLALCALGGVMSNSRNHDVSSAAPLYLLPGVVLLLGAVVLAIGNAAIVALL